MGRREARQLALAVAAYAVAVALSRLIVTSDLAISLIWPASGVAVVWFLLRDARIGSVDTVLFLLVTSGIPALTGAPWQLYLAIGPAAAMVQLHLTVRLVRAWTPELRGAGGQRPLERTVDLWWFTFACGLGSLAGALVGLLPYALVEPISPGVAVVWCGRFVCGTIVVALIGLVTAHWWAHGHRTPVPRARCAELGALLVATAASVVPFMATDLPIAWTLLVGTAWAALRFGPVVLAWHAGLVSVLVVVTTVRGQGSFASIDDEVASAIVAQAFLALMVVIGLATAVGQEERRRLAEDVALAHRAAARQARLMKAIVNTMDEGVVVVEEPRNVEMKNPAAQRLIGFDFGGSIDSVARHVARLDGSRFTLETSMADRALAGEHVVDEDFLILRPDGTKVTARASATPLPPVAPGEPHRVVVVMHDITPDVEKAEALQQFARTVAHDLRNPLGAIGAWVGMLHQKAEADDVSPEFVARIASRLAGASTRLNELVDGLLQRATSTDRELTLARVELDELVRSIVESRRLDDVVSWEPGMPAVEGDGLLVGQVLDNLIGNAVKYVEPDVTPHVEVTADCERPGWVTVRVADNGIGIPGGQHERVFDEFHRAHGSTYRGTGLGLSIVRRVVDRHGGTVSAAPNPSGQGTVFEVTLPAAG